MTPDDERFTAIVAQHKDMLYRICCAYTQDPDARNDLFQEVLIRLWSGADSFRREARLTTWLYRVAVNACLTWVRGERRRTRRFVHTAPEEFESVAAEAPAAPEMDEELRRLYACIARLRPLDRLLVSLYLEESPAGDIAAALGISEGNVRVKLHRIKEELKTIWKEEGYES